MNEDSKLLFIVNKYSGTGYQPAVEGKIIEACEQRNVECSIEFTKSRGHAIELSREAVTGGYFKTVVAVGGDGTVNEVAQGLIHSDVAMGILPKGSGNGLARHLGISMNITRALDSLFSGQIIAMDTFKLNGKLSLNVSGIGFDGHIANLFGTGKKRGLQGYAKLIMNEFFRFKEFAVDIQKEDVTTHHRAFVIAVANSSQYGNNARIAPAASVCDQRLHVNILKKVPPYRLDFIYSFFNGTIDQSSFCQVMTVQNLTIALSEPMAYHIDGEPGGVAQHFSIEIIPSSIKMIAPRTSLKP